MNFFDLFICVISKILLTSTTLHQSITFMFFNGTKYLLSKFKQAYLPWQVEWIWRVHCVHRLIIVMIVRNIFIVDLSIGKSVKRFKYRIIS